MWFQLEMGEPLVIAGLWNSWKKPNGELLKTFTIITTGPNELVAPIHNRMPAVLSDYDALEWVSGGKIGQALSSLKPFSAELMDGYDVSKLVNDPKMIRRNVLHLKKIRSNRTDFGSGSDVPGPSDTDYWTPGALFFSNAPNYS
jgi:putative SOS response-associated peptidase YedK